MISVLREGKRVRPRPGHRARVGRRDPGRARSDCRRGSDLVLRARRGLPERRMSRAAASTSVRLIPVVGGGMAAANCASELRRKGAEGSVLLVGREPEPPYERPPLSKEYLRGEAERKDAYVNEPGWYEENDVELLSGTNVMSLDVEARTAKLQTKEEVEFDKALIATGREREHPPRRGGGAGGDPLPARVRQLGRDPRGGREGRARGADRRQLHRLRGGGVADREGHEMLDRDDGGRGAVADVRRRGRALVPRAARRARGGDPSAARSWSCSRATGACGRSSPRTGRPSRATWSSSAQA